jgi:hypothetical protein
MWLIEILPYKPYVQIEKVRTQVQAEYYVRNDSQYILLDAKQYKYFKSIIRKEIATPKRRLRRLGKERR